MWVCRAWLSSPQALCSCNSAFQHIAAAPCSNTFGWGWSLGFRAWRQTEGGYRSSSCLASSGSHRFQQGMSPARSRLQDNHNRDFSWAFLGWLLQQLIPGGRKVTSFSQEGKLRHREQPNSQITWGAYITTSAPQAGTDLQQHGELRGVWSQ